MQSQGVSITPERLKVSSRAHLIMPYHRALDHTSKNASATKKSARRCAASVPRMKTKPDGAAFRVPDALSPEVLKLRIERNLEEA
jgi:adenylosuccinate synthase